MSCQDFYSRNAAHLAARYETLDPERLHRGWREFRPAAAAAVLEVGAGSGRDAAWLAGMGHAVVAVEPCAALRRAARRRHPRPGISWVDDRLPELEVVCASGRRFDLILVNAVWMHVAPDAREHAIKTLKRLLAPGAVLVVTLRRGPVEADRAMHPCETGELLRLARHHGLAVCKTLATPDRLARREIGWQLVVLRNPGGRGAAGPAEGDALRVAQNPGAVEKDL
jgi:protein-L-isoaspartate O-methyltransferase